MSSNSSPLSQKNLQWANITIGSSPYLIHARGSALTVLAEILELIPDVVNEKLKEVEGYRVDESTTSVSIIWEKIMVAFPGWSAQYVEPYNNQTVLDALSTGRGVIVFTGDHGAVRFIGNAMCHDPLDGTEKPTSTLSDVRGFVFLTYIPPAKTEEPVIAEPVVEPSVPDPVVPEVPEANYVVSEPPVNESVVEYTDPVVAKTVTGIVDKAILKQVKTAKRAIHEIEKLLK